ncbi:MAG: NrfD/PsrC family molybdoenzyme membrane anchor subunit, partial [Candidatus Binatia bacterium]
MAETTLPEENPLESGRPPIIEPGHTFGTVTDHISSVVLTRPPLGWFVGFVIAFSVLLVLLVSLSHLVLRGIGIWGEN